MILDTEAIIAEVINTGMLLLELSYLLSDSVTLLNAEVINAGNAEVINTGTLSVGLIPYL